MFARVRDQIFHKLLGEIHVAVQIAKRHFRLDHPKFTRVPGRVGVLSTKGWSKGVNVGQGQRECLRFQLAAHGEICRPGKEILCIIDFALCGSRHVLGVQRCDAKQFSGSFAVAAGNDWGMNINEAALLKKLVNGKSEPASNAKDTAEKI